MGLSQQEKSIQDIAFSFSAKSNVLYENFLMRQPHRKFCANREELFQGLKIWENEEFRKLQGTYPVLFLRFANIKEIDYQTARRKSCQTLSSLYSRYQFLLDEGCLDEREEDFFRSVSVDMGDVAATMAIHELCFYLSRYYE